LRLLHRSVKAVIAGLLVAGAGAACAQGAARTDYPVKPVRVVTAAAGGGADFAARVVSQGISAPLGQQVIVDNRGGSGGLLAGEMVAKAPADGYTLLLYGNTIWLAPFMRKETPYDPVQDFAPVTLTSSTPTIMVVHPTLPVKTAGDLIKLAKARPGVLNYGSSGTGSASHLAGELFNAMARVDIVRVNYKGAAPAFNDTAAGFVQITYGGGALVMPHLKAGRLKTLGVAQLKRSTLFPDVPTIAETGLPGYEAVSAYGLLAPAKTPAAIINRLQQEIARYFKTPEAQQRLSSAGMEAVAGTPQQLAELIKSEMGKFGKLIRDSGISE
jgi:tripartite-type tricarboxylate transporter receptor subunit TctC